MDENEAQPVYLVTNQHHPFAGRSVVIATGPDAVGLVGVEALDTPWHKSFILPAQLRRITEDQKGNNTMSTTPATGNTHSRHTPNEDAPACPQSYQVGDVVTDGLDTGRVISTQIAYLIETVDQRTISRFESELTLAPQTEGECWLSTAAYIGVLVSEGYDNTAIRNKAYIYLGNLQKANGLTLLNTRTHEETKARLLKITCQARSHVDWINQQIAQGT